MKMADLLQWHYMVFLIPFGIAALMLVYSALNADGGDNDSDADTADGTDGADGDDGGAGSDGDGDADGEEADSGESDAEEAHRHESGPNHIVGPSQAGPRPAGERRAPSFSLLRLLGVGRAPLTMVLETFGMAWGFCGFWANQLLLHTPTPTLTQMIPSFGVALVGGVVGARLSAEILARVLPQEESSVVSRRALFGLTGRVLFPVGAGGGRIRIYDENGTLHDEPCRVAAGHPAIPKGRSAMVLDVDRDGRLVVEEVADTVR